MTEIRGERVVLRTLSAGDAEALRAIVSAPEVAAWWGPQTEEFPMKDEPSAQRLTIFIEEQVAGLIEFHEEPEPAYRHAGIDIFLDPRHHGRGLGTEAVTILARHLIEERGHHRITIDPAVDNAAAVRCYEKAGFRPVGVMRAAERSYTTGAWRDALLMELVVLA